MNRMIKNYAYNFIYQIFSVIVPLITAPYLSRTLGPEGTGIYSYVNSTTVLITTIVMLGIFNYGNRQVAYVRDDKKKLSSTFWSIMSTRIILGILGTIIYFVIVLSVGKYVKYFLIYYTYVLAYFLDCTWLYVGVEDMKWAVLKNFITKLLGVIGIFMFVHTQQDTWKYLLLLGGSVLISNLLAYTQLRRYVEKPHFCISNTLSEICGSAYLFLPSLAATVYLQCDKIMIELMTGETFQVSFYDYSEKIVTIPLTFITVLNAVVMPRLANEFVRKNGENIEKIVNKTLQIVLFFAFPMTMGMMAITDKLIPWYLGKEFLSTITAIKIISPIIILNAMSGVFGAQYFTATNQVRILLKSQISAVILNIVVNAVLIPQYGFQGAGAATVVSSFVCTAIQYIEIKKQMDIYNFGKNIIKYGLISGIMWFFILGISNFMDATPLTSFIQITTGGLSYFLICILFKDNQIQELFKEIKKRKNSFCEKDK